MGRIGPAFLVPYKQHDEHEEPIVKDLGGMLHKAMQLVGDYDGAEVRISGSIDPAGLTGQTTARAPAMVRKQSWTEIATLTNAEPYKHHTGWVRWVRVEIVKAAGGEFGVAVMGED
jgi:hypothetical protein